MARILIDTNILLRSLNPEDPHCPAADKAVATLRLRNETLCLAPQNLIEFWAVVTRPREDNGLGMSPARAMNEPISLRQSSGCRRQAWTCWRHGSGSSPDGELRES